MPSKLLYPQLNNRCWTDECLPATTSTVLPLCGRNCNNVHATSLHCMERPFISSVLAMPPFPRPASASHLPPNSPTIARGASSVLVHRLPPASFLFLAISLTRVCASHSCSARPLAQGLRGAAGLPAMGLHAFGPPGVRRLVVGASASLHLFAPPAETRHSVPHGSPLTMQLRWSARPWSSSPAADLKQPGTPVRMLWSRALYVPRASRTCLGIRSV
jgi:hypothetical protein